MSADNPQGGLEGDENGPMVGSLILIVGFALVAWVLLIDASPEVVLLAALIWVLGSVLRIVEVLRA